MNYQSQTLQCQRRALEAANRRRLTGNSCHPAGTTLELFGGAHARIDEVRVGDLVRTPEGYEPVTGFMHAEPDKVLLYYRFDTASASLAISDLHWLIVNGVETDPALVKVGDILTTTWGEQPVIAAKVEEERGAYHVQVPSGRYYADGVLASTYIAHVPLGAWKLFADTYAAARYALGVPLTPEGEGPASIFWTLHVYQALGVPAPLAAALWPLTMTATLAAELTNTAAVHGSSVAKALALAAAVPAVVALARPRK